jgi:hypothetical protein
VKKEENLNDVMMSSPGKPSVLSQVTNSYVAPTIEGKGDFMQMDGITQGSF